MAIKNMDGTHKNQSEIIFYYCSWITFLSSILGQVIILALLFSTFKDSDNKLVEVVNAFFSTYDSSQTDPAWQVASQHWGLPSGAIANPSVNTYSPYYTDEIITPMAECMFSAQIGISRCNNDTLNSYYKCINSNFATELGVCNGLPSNRQYLYPIRQDYAECIWKKVGSNKGNNLTVLSRCMDITFWPIYEVIQDVDSKYFLGSYNWAHLVLVGFFLFCNILMFSSTPWEKRGGNFEIKGYKIHPLNQDSGLMIRGSKMQAYVCLVMLVVFFGIQCGLFGGQSPIWFDNYGFPSSTSTLILVLTFTVAVFVYFLLEIAEFMQEDTGYQRIKSDRVMMQNIPVAFQMQSPNTGYYAQEQHHETKNEMLAAHHLGPNQMKIWADANLANVIFFIGVIGCTQQVLVIEIYNVFTLLIVLRLIDMNFARISLHGELSEEAYRLSLRLSSLFVAIYTCIIIWNTNKVASESATLTAISILCLFVPELLKLIFEIYTQWSSFKADEMYLKIYNTYFYQFICAWNVIIQLIFVFVIFWGIDAYGNLSFLRNRHGNLITWMNL